MTSTFQPPPTYADPFLLDESLHTAYFNPIWLRWFLDLIRQLNADGASKAQNPVTVSYPVTSGFALTLANETQFVIINATAPMAIGTLIFPPNPTDGSWIIVSTNQIIKSLILTPNTGQTIYNAASALNLSLTTPLEISGFGLGYVYSTVTNAWHRFI